MQPPPVTGLWTVLQHVAWEGPGLIVTEARARGLQLDIRRIDLGAAVPKASEIAGLIVMGGPMGVYESQRYPFLQQECWLIDELIRCRRPVLGICLGAQLLAHALGAAVYPGHGPEIGFGFVDLTSEGKQDPVLGSVAPSFPAFHWHGDTFNLPTGAVLLASSSAYPHQAFRCGDLAYGFQFHIEPDAATWPVWREHLPDRLIDGTAPEQDQIVQTGETVIRNLFNVLLADRAAGCDY